MYKFEKTTSRSILPVTAVYRDGNEFLLTCPHCGHRRGIEASEGLIDVVGEQFQDNLCDGWFEITDEVNVVADIDVLDEQPFAMRDGYEEDEDVQEA